MFFFKQVNIQLYSPSEKEQLLNLVSTMVSYNLGYHQERNSDGQYTYVLQPLVVNMIRKCLCQMKYF